MGVPRIGRKPADTPAVAPSAPSVKAAQPKPRASAPESTPGVTTHKRPAQAAPIGAQPWESRYLEILEQHGNMSLAAKTVGISPYLVKKHRAESDAFNERWLAAMDFYLDSLESGLGKMGLDKNNAIAMIARLRADRPQRYLDKVQIAQHISVAHRYEPDPAEVQALLLQFTRDMTPESRANLGLPPAALTDGGEIIDVPAEPAD